MGIFKQKLNNRYKMLAVQLTREHFATSGGYRVPFERLLREDSRVKRLDTMLAPKVLKLAWMVFEYLQNKPANNTSAIAETDNEIYANSLRYEVND